MSRLPVAFCALTLALVLPATPGVAAMSGQPSVASGITVLAEDEDGGSQVPTEISHASVQTQQDLFSLTAVRESAEARMRGAEKQAAQVASELRRHEKAAAEAREVIGLYMRSIYMNGPTDLTMLASLIDSESPGDLVSRADKARRVGDHKDDQYDDAVLLVQRSEESKAASEAAVGAAKQSLSAIEDQMNGLRQDRADQVGELADQVGQLGGLLDPEQVNRNSSAALSWAKYLGQLAKFKVPPLTYRQMKKGPLPTGVTVKKKQPGVAVFKKGNTKLTVLPERTIAAVTYAVSRLGSAYKWQANTSKEMDCSSLIDRAWNVPGLKSKERDQPRALVSNGVRGLALRTRLLKASDGKLGDVVFLSDDSAGVNHVGITLTNHLMVAADPSSGGINAIPIDGDRAWKAARLALPEPRDSNKLPSSGKKKFQCGADPDSFISLPDGKVLAHPKLCPPSPGVFGESYLQPTTIQIGRCIKALWPQIQSIGGWRPSDPYPDHPSGHALDIMMPAGCDASPENVGIGNQIAQFLMANAERFDVKYMIWQHRIWNSATTKPTPIAQWRMMSERGGCTANHMDHVHVTTNGSAPAPGAPVPVQSEPDPEVDDADEKKAAKKADAKKASAKKADAKEAPAKSPSKK